MGPRSLLSALLLAGCGGPVAAPEDLAHVHVMPDFSVAPDATVPTGPDSLADTGLYADFAARTLAPGVIRFRPRYELWSDGATKERYLWLPPGTKIDTRDMDAWR